MIQLTNPQEFLKNLPNPIPLPLGMNIPARNIKIVNLPFLNPKTGQQEYRQQQIIIPENLLGSTDTLLNLQPAPPAQSAPMPLTPLYPNQFQPTPSPTFNPIADLQYSFPTPMTLPQQPTQQLNFNPIADLKYSAPTSPTIAPLAPLASASDNEYYNAMLKSHKASQNELANYYNFFGMLDTGEYQEELKILKKKQSEELSKIFGL